MPFKSKAQMRKFFAMEDRGELPEGKAEEWADETPDLRGLPERKKKRTKKAMLLKMAHDIGMLHAIEESGLAKTASLEGALLGLIRRTAPVAIPTVAGAAMAGPDHRLEGALGGLALGALGAHGARHLTARSLGYVPGTKRWTESMRWLRGGGSPIARGEKIDRLTKATQDKIDKLTRKGKQIPEALAEKHEQQAAIAKRLRELESWRTPMQWGGRLAGGLGAGYAVKELIDTPSAGGGGQGFSVQPAVSDMGTHYTGLVPDYY